MQRKFSVCEGLGHLYQPFLDVSLSHSLLNTITMTTITVSEREREREIDKHTERERERGLDHELSLQLAF